MVTAAVAAAAGNGRWAVAAAEGSKNVIRGG
jgi:hypothetical protein